MQEIGKLGKGKNIHLLFRPAPLVFSSGSSQVFEAVAFEEVFGQGDMAVLSPTREWREAFMFNLSAASPSFNMKVSRVYGFFDAALFGTRPAQHTVL
jgi:hypothetical protein